MRPRQKSRSCQINSELLLVNELGFPIIVCHLAPGTSKWNNIKHRLFSFITKNWHGKPLVTSYARKLVTVISGGVFG